VYIIIIMSSRSLAAARSRRAGESAPPVSGNRPGTSINSHAAFAQQGPGQGQPPSNVRVSRGPQSQTVQDVRQSQQQSQASLPFSKLSISDAIGLITLRLGRVEQWVMETDHETDGAEHHHSSESNLPNNSKVIDISVLTNIINRLDSLEKMGGGSVGNESVSKLTEEVAKLTQQVTRIGDDGNKQMLAVSKHTEQLFKFERDLVETKDILKTFMLRYDAFVQESAEKFTDFETALTEVERGLQVTGETADNGTDIHTLSVGQETSGPIESADLQSMVKQEMANSSI
jgi:hypothetical protein